MNLIESIGETMQMANEDVVTACRDGQSKQRSQAQGCILGDLEWRMHPRAISSIDPTIATHLLSTE